ncbi:MAG: rhodanese-like domain-containing protein [Bacteroidales bacterium]|nr:rhodanese-like domain-containing protein [Bacteroidales bacterium]
MKSFKTIFVVLILFSVFSCSKEQENINTKERGQLPSTEVQYISQEELKSQFENNGYFVLVDCREENEFAEGHISKAINIPRGLLEFSKKLENKNERLFLYSDSLERAVLGAEALKKLNFKRVYVLKGGLNRWKINYPKEIEQSDDNEEAVEESSCG